MRGSRIKEQSIDDKLPVCLSHLAAENIGFKLQGDVNPKYDLAIATPVFFRTYHIGRR